MPHFCAAFGCSKERNAKTKEEGITFHRFPKDHLKRQAWTVALRRKNFLPNDHSVVCSCHFKPEDFDKTGQTTRLREGAIPSVFVFSDQHNKAPSTPRSDGSKDQAPPARSPAREPDVLDLSKDSTSVPSTPSSSTSKQQAPTTRSRSPVGGHGVLDLSKESASVPSTTRSPTTSQQAPAARSRSPIRGLQVFSVRKKSDADHLYNFDPIKAKQKLFEAQEKLEELQRSMRNARARERRQKKTLKSLSEELKIEKKRTGELQQKLGLFSGAQYTQVKQL